MDIHEVWVTLKGQHLHVDADCPGIADGHAKARAEGNRNHAPEKYPVHLALSGFPWASPREPCARCLLGVPLSTAPDLPAAVSAAKGGLIATLVARRRLRPADVDPAPWEAFYKDEWEGEGDLEEKIAYALEDGDIEYDEGVGPQGRSAHVDY